MVETTPRCGVSRGAATAGAVGMLVLAAVLALPGAARAQNTCNAFISIAYASALPFSNINDVVRVRLTLSAGSIQNGTKVSISRLRFELDCSVDGPLGLGCIDDGAVIQYEGDGTITNTCGVTFTTGHAVSALPNQVVFQADNPIMIPANTQNFCALEFDVRVIGFSNDSTPQKAEEVGGYSAANNDARCDNNLASSGSQSAAIDLCPACQDTDCADFECNQQTGVCEPTFLPPSTPCPDTDNDLCTTAGCDPQGNCSQTHIVTPCPADDCNTGQCNPSTGQCILQPPSTPCTDNDNDPCSTAGCDPNGMCNQNHIRCVTTTTTTSTTTTTTPVCIPEPEDCTNMVDDDCDNLVDCDDPDCGTQNGILICSGGAAAGQSCATAPDQANCTNGGGRCVCGTIQKDPSTIRFGPPGAGLDVFQSHGRVVPSGSIDVMNSDIGWVVSGPNGLVYSGTLHPGDLTPNAKGTLFRFSDPGARTGNGSRDGIFKAKIHITRGGSSYGYKVTAYGDMSNATDPDMSIQFYVGEPPQSFIHHEPWKQFSWGWKATGFE